MEKTFRIRDPETLRAASHPLRQRIIFDLQIHGHGRAADLARRLDEPANSISFHLRVLAKAGMIVEAPELARDKRDRVWAPAAENFNVDAGVPGVGDIVADAAALLRENHAFAARHDGEDAPPEPEDAPKRALTIRTALLTRRQAEAMADELNDVMERWQDAARATTDGEGRPETAALYQVVFGLGPLKD
ncbi:winged helix-turn-helix domain-containing protein [Myceligenerans salitolerans]|uniref:Helix-turn-helix transcriptional regulator n=1 Tax=Myceligenerans salitolerans TaxID=1230528 RepID=A0ABS3ICS5_9MICO|nr:helix-turn-helix domain-containing protein [Myceligenerans salitolerans]MBO0610748.1 helix-turn-helix transcriptional regulator [Myceligenerans salitolerans]